MSCCREDPEPIASRVLSQDQIDQFQRDGHLTVEGVFSPNRMAEALEDERRWGVEFLAAIEDDQRKWYVEETEDGPRLRKLDNPAFHRKVFQDLASDSALVAMVEQLIGRGVRVFFSQVFCKPPRGGGPKPIHQDNYYFDPSDRDAMVTVWVALEDATVDNGCLFYGNRSHWEAVLPHYAPEDQPFNLQVSEKLASRYPMNPAPIRQGGVSLHHGNTLHRSSRNTSAHSRSAVAFHFLRNDASLVDPKLAFDPSVEVIVSQSA